jgi:hypothetical protein
MRAVAVAGALALALVLAVAVLTWFYVSCRDDPDEPWHDADLWDGPFG